MSVTLAEETTAGTMTLLPSAVMWHAESAAEGLLRVRIDRQDTSVNALSHGMLDELERLLVEIRRTPAVRGAMFFSGKPGNFIVGADVNELKSLDSGSGLSLTIPHSNALSEVARGPDLGAAAQARELSQFGQRVFERLEALPIPTVALISGACLGGGLEFAMSCRYRIADDNAKTLLGLPEVKLGLIPGWGGTVRLPKLMGLADALPMILTGRMLNGRQAKSKGLVDDTVPTEGLRHVGESLLRTVITRGSARSLFKPTTRSLLFRMVELMPVLRNLLVFRRAEQETLKQTRGHYPAPLAAIETMRVGFRQPPNVGFAAESAAIGRLADSPVTRECLRLFFLQEEAKNPTQISGERGVSTPRLSGDLNGHQMADAPRSPMNAAVIGAGAMGAGIALLMAQKGIWTRLKDLKPEFVAKGMQTIRQLVHNDLQRRRVTPLQATDTLDHLRPTTEYDGLQHADLVIEAVVEDVSIKQQVFCDLAQATGPRTVLATNTSSLLLRDIAASVPHPERVVGLHFFNPPHQMPLVEVVCTEQSSPGAVAVAFALAQRLGKTAVIVEDCAGFLVNRLLAPYLNEAGYLLLEVSDPLEIDRAAVAFGLPMGPLELTDLVGLEVARHVAENLHAAYGERMVPAPLWAALKDMSNQPQKGRPSLLVGKGRRKKLNPTVRRAIANVRQSGTFTVPGGTPSRDEITQRLIFPIINEAARCLDEGIVSRPEEIDLAMVFGTGFAPFRGGPMRYAETLGFSTIVNVLEQLAVTRLRLAPSDALRRMASGS